MPDEEQTNEEFKIDRSNLFIEESFTDLKIGTVKRLRRTYQYHDPQRPPADSKCYRGQGIVAGNKKISRGNAGSHGPAD